MPVNCKCSDIIKISVSYRGKRHDVKHPNDVYSYLPKKWSTSKFLKRGYFPSGLTPSFSTNSYSKNYTRVARLVKEISNNAYGRTTFSFPRPGLLERRRTAYLINPIAALNVSNVVQKNWSIYKSMLSTKTKCVIETSIPMNDPEQLRYLVPAINHTKLYSLIDHVHSAYNNLIVADVQAYYPSIYTHSIEWALAGKKYVKENFIHKCENILNNDKYKAGCELDKSIRETQEKETYGTPIGIDSSFIVSEIIGKGLIGDITKRLEQKCIAEYFIIRHVDDFYIYTNEDPHKIIGILRDSFREWNLQLNETKLSIHTPNKTRDDLWVYELASFQADGEDDEIELSDIVNASLIARAGRETIGYQKIDYWNLERYFSLMRTLQEKYNNKSVVTYALRRLHFNNRIDPLKGYGKRYLFNPEESFYQNMDSQLSILAVSYPQYIDVIADVYLWYYIWRRYRPKHIKYAIAQIITKMSDSSSHQFEMMWALWLARYFTVELPSKAMESLLVRLEDPLIALQALDYAHWWEGATGISLTKYIKEFVNLVKNGNTNIQPASTLEEAFTSKDWIFYYSLEFTPLKEAQILQLPISNSSNGIGKYIKTMKDMRVQFFLWRKVLPQIDKLLGVSRHGRGGVSAKVYPM